MNCLDELHVEHNRIDKKTVEDLIEFDVLCKDFLSLINEQEQRIIALQRNSTKGKRQTRTVSKASAKSGAAVEEGKENVIIKAEQLEAKTDRPRRAAFKEATENVREQVNGNPNLKLHRKSLAHVKTEKIDSFRADNDVRNENGSELMPPPLVLPKRRGRPKKLTETNENNRSNVADTQTKKVKQETIESDVKNTRCTRSKALIKKDISNRKDSDVIESTVPPTIIEPIDSVDEKENDKTFVKEASATNVETKSSEKTISKHSECSTESDTVIKTSETVVDSKSLVVEEVATNEAFVTGKIQNSSKKTSTSDEESIAKTGTKKRTKTKRKKSHKSVDQEEHSDYKDAVSDVTPVSLIVNETITISNPESKLYDNINATIVLSKDSDADNLSKALNTTVVIQKATPNAITAARCNDSLLTEDEDPPPPPIKKKAVKTDSKIKPIFDPYSNSPVKHRVEAFERMANAVAVASVEDEIPVRITRTKKRADDKKKESRLEENNHHKQELQKLKEKPAAPKFFTPSYGGNRVLPSAIGSASRYNSVPRLNVSEQKDRDLKRKEREEAQRKKEAMLYEKAELQKKKREEKQQKAQQIREELERDKRKLYEKEKLEKDARLEKALAEKEEKQNRQKEENMRKKIVVQKVLEEKRMHAEKQLLEADKEKHHIQVKQSQTLVVENGAKTPPLVAKNAVRPEWASTYSLQSTCRLINYLHEKTASGLFSAKATTPNLRDIFCEIETKKLTRSSSACWNTPPRFSKFNK